jgi:hypothetical protein
MAAMATGQFEFVHNVQSPACCTESSCDLEVGASLVSVDEVRFESSRDREGRHAKDFVGVVAEKPWQARQAAQKLQIQWTRGVVLPAHSPLEF